MATTITRTLDPTSVRPSSSRRKKDHQPPRTDIWSNLLRQTREAQARSRRQTLLARDLIICGGSPEDQRNLVERYVARPPPNQPPTNRNSQRDHQRVRGGAKGEVQLSNRFAYGYGHVTLFAPPMQTSGPGGLGGGGGGGLFGGETEEVAKVEVHTIPAAEKGYEEILRRLLRPRRKGKGDEGVGGEDDDGGGGDDAGGEGDVEGDALQNHARRPAVCILMSWKQPWLFLHTLRRWLALLSRALLSSSSSSTTTTSSKTDPPPLEILRDHNLALTLILQHTDHQDHLLRESYTEESFDYISQCLRTCLLPLAGALVYVPTNLPPQQPGGPLSEVQKVLYTSLGLDVSALQAKSGKPEAATPTHNVVDRMAIVVPSGWDSHGKIRLLSETFSPEAVAEGWMSDLELPVFFDATTPKFDEVPPSTTAATANDLQPPSATDGPEIYETSHQQPSPMVGSPNIPTPPLSPSKMPKSAIAPYENQIRDPNAHKAPKPPEIEVLTKPEQDFLAEMRAQLQQFEAQDQAAATRERDGRASTTAGALSSSRVNSGGATPVGAGSGEALSELGDVSFNVGGVSYNTVTAEAAIERLKRPPQPSSSSSAAGAGDSRSGTPRPGRRAELRDGSSAEGTTTPGSGGGSGAKSEIPTEKLEEYFASLMKKGGGTPSRH